MSRTPGLWCLVDVRTTAILQDQILKTNPCAPGAEVAKTRRRKFGGKTLLENCDDPACGFDRGKDFISILGGMVVVATIFGILNSMPIFIPYASIEYEAGYIELNLIWATSLLVFNITSGISSPIIEYAGHRLTALFGMLFVFVGVLLDSQVFHIAVLWVGYVVLVGIGGGLAYSASFCLPADLFRKKLVLGLLIMCIADKVGTIFYSWLVITVVAVVGYKWTKLMLSIMVLFFTLAVHVYPKTRLMYAAGCTPDENGGEENKSAKIRECVYKTVKTKKQEDECEHERHCLCVCVCDMRLFTDKSFLLWASLFMIATVNFGVPYMAFVSYAETVGAPISAWYITSYSIASVAARCGMVANPDFTFIFNRTIFQVCLVFSGFMWIIFCWATTFGWFIVCSIFLGVVEGILCVVISRVGVGTIPRDWIGGAWLAAILTHGVGTYGMTIFTAVIAYFTLQYYVAFITVGIMQIIVAFLAFLLPNEEDEGSDDPQDGIALNITNGPCSPSFGTTTMPYSSSQFYRYRQYGGYTGSPSTYAFSSGVHAGGLTKSSKYGCQCPICTKYGCISDCLPKVCAPGDSLIKEGQQAQSSGKKAGQDQDPC